MAGFQNVLKRLVEDHHYRETVAKDVHALKRDHDLDAEELALLMQVWVNSSAAARASIWDLCHCCCSVNA
jgi:hypothetical protein